MNEKLIRVLTVGACTLTLAAQSNAFNLYYTEDRYYVPAVSQGGGYTYLDPDHVYRILPSSSQAIDAENLIEAGWPSWNVSRSSTYAPGDVAVTNYSAWQGYASNGHVDQAGAQLVFHYISTDSSWSSYRFVQIIYTNAPTGGNSSPYLDPGLDPDYYPFYYDEDYNTAMRSGTSYIFSDWPKRSYDGSNAIGWAGALFLVEWYSGFGGNAIIIHDGVYWGWRTIGTGGNEFWGGGEDPVPEPSSLIAISFCIAATLRSRRVRR